MLISKLLSRLGEIHLLLRFCFLTFFDFHKKKKDGTKRGVTNMVLRRMHFANLNEKSAV